MLLMAHYTGSLIEFITIVSQKLLFKKGEKYDFIAKLIFNLKKEAAIGLFFFMLFLISHI